MKNKICTGSYMFDIFTRKMHSVGLLMLVSIFILTWYSCEDEGDSLEEIIIDKKFKITGCVYNGVSVNDNEVRQLYTSPYFLGFANTTFTAELVTGSNVSGEWSADGSRRSIIFKIKQKVGVEKTNLSRQVFEILENVKKYSGDSNVIVLYKDNDNFLILNANFNFN